MKKLIATLFIFSFLAVGSALAQETVSVELEMDETITAESLGVSDQNLLPDNPFYFLKNIGRGIQNFFAFSEEKKLELRERFSNEKLIEVKNLIEKGADQETVVTAIKNYQGELTNMQDMATKVEESNGTTTSGTIDTSKTVNKFLDNFVQKQALQQRLIQKLETQVSENALIQIREAKGRQIENFGEVMTKLEAKNTEKIQERLERNLQEIQGSELKDIKGLEILDALYENVSAEAKEAISNIQAKTFNKLQEVMQSLPEAGEKLQNYIENSTGDKETQLDILNTLKDTPEIKDTILDSRQQIMNQIQERVTEMNTCSGIAKPASTFCTNGRVNIKKDANGCITSFECFIPDTSSSVNGGGVNINNSGAVKGNQ